jgi:hypothetical protein
MKKIIYLLGLLFAIVSCNVNTNLVEIEDFENAKNIIEKDEVFNIYLSKVIELQKRVSLKSNFISDDIRRKRIIELSKLENPTDNEFEELSKLCNFNNSTEFKSYINDLNLKALTVKQKFPELINITSPEMEKIVANSSFIQKRNKSAKELDDGCKNGYGVCLIKTAATGAAGLLACAATGPLAPWCAAAVTVATFAGYEECAITYCGSGLL